MERRAIHTDKGPAPSDGADPFLVLQHGNVLQHSDSIRSICTNIATAAKSGYTEDQILIPASAYLNTCLPYFTPRSI